MTHTVHTELFASGSIVDFATTGFLTALRTKIAGELGVPVWRVNVRIAAGSVRIIITVAYENQADAQAGFSTLSAQTATPELASTFVSTADNAVTVLSVAAAPIVQPFSPSPPPLAPSTPPPPPLPPLSPPPHDPIVCGNCGTPGGGSSSDDPEAWVYVLIAIGCVLVIVVVVVIVKKQADKPLPPPLMTQHADAVTVTVPAKAKLSTTPQEVGVDLQDMANAPASDVESAHLGKNATTTRI